MIIQLLDYSGKKYPVDVPDNTQEIFIRVISGDMVLFEPIYFNTGKDTRAFSFFDGEYIIERKDFDKLSSFTSSYDLSSLNDD